MKRIPAELNKLLCNRIAESRYRYPIKFSIDQLASELQKATGLQLEEVRGYITGFFDLLKLIGSSDYEGSGEVVLHKEIHAAMARAVCLAIQEETSDLFIFPESDDVTNPSFGSWLLHRLEERRLIYNPASEPSRVCDHVVVLVKAMLQGKPAILLQHEGQRAWATYKFIGGRVRAADRGNLLAAARREIEEEVRSKDECASNIKPRRLSLEPYEYCKLSERLGAFTLYRASVFDCTLTLPQGCLKEEFVGHKGRKTRWFPLDEITLENDEISQKEVLRWILDNGWLGLAPLSTSQQISKVQQISKARRPRTVFVSSTWQDLRKYRAAAMDQIVRRDMQFRGMEHFGADPTGTSPAQRIVELVREADVYLGIFGVRYGSVDETTGLSMTELEYDEAEASGKPMLLYVIADDAPVKVSDIEPNPESKAKLDTLKDRILRNHVCHLFHSVQDLARQIYEDLGKL